MGLLNAIMAFTEHVSQPFRSIFSPKFDLLWLSIISLGFGGLGVIFEEWFWSPVWTFIFLVLVRLFDVVTAIDLAIYRGGGFETKKLYDTIVSFTFLLIFLGILHNLPKLNAEWGFIEMDQALTLFPKIMYCWVLFNQISSAAKNAALAKRIDGPFANFIIKYIDRNKDAISLVLDEDTKPDDTKG